MLILFTPAMRNSLLAVSFGLLISGCATEKSVHIQQPKPPLMSGEIEGDFCMAGTNPDLGGIAKMSNRLQHAIGKCKHPSIGMDDMVVLYFGDDGRQAPEAYLAEEVDYQAHKDQYLTKEEIAEIDCLEGSECLETEKFLKNGVVVHFATDSSTPANSDELLLVEKLAKLASSKKIRLSVAGHTDNTASDSHNAPLSIRRAKSIENILRAHGVDGATVIATGRSSANPVASNDTPEGRAMNRRAEVKKGE